MKKVVSRFCRTSGTVTVILVAILFTYTLLPGGVQAFGDLSENGTAYFMGIGTNPHHIRPLYLLGNVCLFERQANSAGFILHRSGGDVIGYNRWVFGADEPTGFVIKTYPYDGATAIEQLVITKDDPVTPANESKVGIGTTSPAYKVHVVSDNATSGAAAVCAQSESANTFGASCNSLHGVGALATTGDGVAVKVESASGNLMEAWDTDDTYHNRNIRFKMDNSGNVWADGNLSQPASDLAELLPAADGLEPGDVLVIGADAKLARSSSACSAAVAGVYSTKPAILCGASEDGDTTGKAPLAVIGVVPVKASAENGSINPGDLLCTSGTPGHAMKAVEPKLGSVIGKSLGSLASGTGMIRVLVTLQ